MITALRHTGLVVANLEAAIDFWCDHLDLRVVRRLEESGPFIDAILGLKDTRVTTVKLAAPDGNLIELLHFHSHPDRPSWTGKPYSTGFTHVAFTVDDVDATCRKLAAAGITCRTRPQRSPDGRAKVTFCDGPEGVLLELVEELSQ